MGDTSDGSSSAAQRALSEGTEARPGFLTRLFKSRQSTGAGFKNNTSTPHLTESLGHLRTVRVENVMIPRADITAVANDLELDQLIIVFRDSGFTRLPVYDETMDSPQGFVHLKDIALKHGFNGKTPNFDMTKATRQLLFAPPSMPIGVLLQKMQSERIHMALVIDEYGGVDGLVTIEDLVEQVVGEITDEHDSEEEATWIEEKPGIYLCQARAPLEDFEKVLGVDLASDTDDEDIDTLGGLVFMMIGRVPARGEVVRHPSGYEFEVVDADPRRIKRLRVCKMKTKD